MKKLLLTLGLAGLTLSSALAQGTINPLNGTLTRFKIDTNGDGVGDRNVTAAEGFVMAVYYGPAGSSESELTMYPDVMRIGTTDGVFTGLPSILALPGTEPGQVISLQMRVCNPLGWYGATVVKQVRLGPTSGPSPVVWSSTGTGDRFSPIQLQLGGPMNCIPEPSTVGLGMVCAGLLVAFYRGRKQSVD